MREDRGDQGWVNVPPDELKPDDVRGAIQAARAEIVAEGGVPPFVLCVPENVLATCQDAVRDMSEIADVRTHGRDDGILTLREAQKREERQEEARKR